MNMQIGAADSAGMYLDQYLIAFHFGIGYIAVSKISGRIVDDRFHDGRRVGKTLLCYHKKFNEFVNKRIEELSGGWQKQKGA
jgi:hypothetical protein